jgi:hypothetical protein
VDGRASRAGAGAGNRRGVSMTRQGHTGWMAPDQGWIKIKTDAGICAQRRVSSAGVVIRDEKGSILLTAWQMLKQSTTVEEDESWQWSGLVCGPGSRPSSRRTAARL